MFPFRQDLGAVCCMLKVEAGSFQEEGGMFLPNLQSVHSVVASASIAPVLACINARNGALADIFGHNLSYEKLIVLACCLGDCPSRHVCLAH